MEAHGYEWRKCSERAGKSRSYELQSRPERDVKCRKIEGTRYSGTVRSAAHKKEHVHVHEGVRGGTCCMHAHWGTGKGKQERESMGDGSRGAGERVKTQNRGGQQGYGNHKREDRGTCTHRVTHVHDAPCSRMTGCQLRTALKVMGTHVTCSRPFRCRCQSSWGTASASSHCTKGLRKWYVGRLPLPGILLMKKMTRLSMSSGIPKMRNASSYE